MSDLLEHEPVIRSSVFAAVLLVMLIWEVLAPRRTLVVPRRVRWVSNVALSFINTAVLRFAFPMLAVGLAELMESRGWGVFNLLALPAWLELVAAVVLLDLAIYVQHVIFHKVPMLWRLHRLHHADIDIDVTTGVRFHPIEILLSMLIKFAMVALLGPAAVAVMVFEVLLNGTSMFNHSNIRIPLRVDRILRWIVVTPDMHRVHHSIHEHEANSNFGLNLPWWDRLLGTYMPQPRDTHEGMIVGVDQFRTRRDLWIDRMLVQPLRGETGAYPIRGELDEERVE